MPGHGAADGYEPILEELLRLYPNFMNAGAGEVGDQYQQVSHIAHGWYQRCHRGIQSILILDSRGFAEEASPIRRSIVEHNVALQWLVAEGDQILDTIARGHAFAIKRQREAVEGSLWTSIDLNELDAAIASTEYELRDPSSDNLLHFAERVKRYSDTGTMPIWLSEVARTHPSYESAVCYVELPEGHLRQRSKDVVWQVPFATTWLLEALMTLRLIFVKPPWPELLGEIGDSYKRVNNEARVEQGLLPVDWSTGRLVS